MSMEKPEREFRLEQTCKELVGMVAALLQHLEDGTTPGEKTRQLFAERMDEAQKVAYVQPHLRIRLKKAPCDPAS